LSAMRLVSARPSFGACSNWRDENIICLRIRRKERRVPLIAAYSRFASICAAMVMLVGCGGSRLSMMDASGVAPQGRDATASPADDMRYPEHGNSWMSPAAKTTKKLLYISD